MVSKSAWSLAGQDVAASDLGLYCIARGVDSTMSPKPTPILDFPSAFKHRFLVSSLQSNSCDHCDQKTFVGAAVSRYVPYVSVFTSHC